LYRRVTGRKAGEPPVRIVDSEVLVRRERLALIGPENGAAEGFAEMTPAAALVESFGRRHTGCTPGTVVSRIRWRYLD
jgi:hypothetical protein